MKNIRKKSFVGQKNQNNIQGFKTADIHLCWRPQVHFLETDGCTNIPSGIIHHKNNFRRVMNHDTKYLCAPQ